MSIKIVKKGGNEKLEELKKLLEENPKMTKTALAKQLGIGRTRLYELLKALVDTN
ncbi:hypothetical protein BCJMU51_p321 (plasmid) [Bacillus cereus]|uniref:winged helix-turn-helix transcriptional regulator n=1 Tax=Bacillus cereus group TaxID=86661 RepID=UPI001BB395FA|nr:MULTISPECIES: winged helix-turn-helix transcriptional regulator [Bacillus cereus group]BCC44654.1 hypothetical protein BCJMU01_p306 [Bacillus cereus]BCC74267.1 hypothetical protein BCJMU51_p321 [Bacillus cereus]BCD33047.1 hypothetical protein BC30102_p716 [Bacillus cereus]